MITALFISDTSESNYLNITMCFEIIYDTLKNNICDSKMKFSFQLSFQTCVQSEWKWGSLTDDVGLSRKDGILQLIGNHTELIIWCPVNSDCVMRCRA